MHDELQQIRISLASHTGILRKNRLQHGGELNRGLVHAGLGADNLMDGGGGHVIAA